MLRILKKDGRARRCEFETVHGTIQTPVFMNVGTCGAIKGGISSMDLKDVKCQVELSNTYHLHIRPGDKLIHDLGGLHRFMNWDRPILTDSGGFQVFSLAQLRKITEEGVKFASHIDGKRIFMGPEESMQIQSNLGSTIAMAFDECIENPAKYDYTKQSCDRTVRWLKRCKAELDRLNSLPDTINKHQMLFGINQGSTYEDLRIKHMQEIAELDLDGYAIGGLAVGEETEEMYRIIDIVEPHMPVNKPRYLMGVGTPCNILEAVHRGIDFFDCVMPSRNARHGNLFTWHGKMNIMNEKYRDDSRPIDENCDCPACKKRVEEDGNPAGLMMEFSNEIATEIKTWLAETNPERKLTLVTFAYNATAFPPVKYDKDLREYVPLKETYKAVDNLAVMVVPRGAAHSKSLFDEKFNKRVKEQLLGWKAVSKQLHIWTYCVNYDHFLINFNNIHALRENYQIYRDIGTTFLFDQGATNVRTPCFDMLRMFVQSELLWDTSLDTDALIDEFINAYYMELAPYMKEYFNKVFNRWKIIESKYGIQSYTGGGSTYYLRKDFWPKDFVDECMDLFRIMRGEIERFATIEEWDKYVLLRKRLYREWLSVRYLLLHLYGNYFGEDLAIKIKTFREDCKRYEVDPYNEGAEMIDIF